MNIVQTRSPEGSTPWIAELRQERARLKAWAEEALLPSTHFARLEMVREIDRMLEEEGA